VKNFFERILIFRFPEERIEIPAEARRYSDQILEELYFSSEQMRNCLVAGLKTNREEFRGFCANVINRIISHLLTFGNNNSNDLFKRGMFLFSASALRDPLLAVITDETQDRRQFATIEPWISSIFLSLMKIDAEGARKAFGVKRFAQALLSCAKTHSTSSPFCLEMFWALKRQESDSEQIRRNFSNSALGELITTNFDPSHRNSKNILIDVVTQIVDDAKRIGETGLMEIFGANEVQSGLLDNSASLWAMKTNFFLFNLNQKMRDAYSTNEVIQRINCLAFRNGCANDVLRLALKMLLTFCESCDTQKLKKLFYEVEYFGQN
jgi:hypothetical protein